MLTKTTATLRLRRNIAANEETVAAATAAIAETIATAALAQAQVPGAPAATAQKTMQHLSKAAELMIAAQAEVLRAHGALLDISRVVNGPEEECPDTLAVPFIGAQLASA